VIPWISGSSWSEPGAQNIEDLKIGEEVRGSHWIRVESAEAVRRVLPDGSHAPAVEGRVWPDRTAIVLPEGTGISEPPAR
jgi:hypothetical protein